MMMLARSRSMTETMLMKWLITQMEWNNRIRSIEIVQLKQSWKDAEENTTIANSEHNSIIFVFLSCNCIGCCCYENCFCWRLSQCDRSIVAVCARACAKETLIWPRSQLQSEWWRWRWSKVDHLCLFVCLWTHFMSYEVIECAQCTAGARNPKFFFSDGKLSTFICAPTI